MPSQRARAPRRSFILDAYRSGSQDHGDHAGCRTRLPIDFIVGHENRWGRRGPSRA